MDEPKILPASQFGKAISRRIGVVIAIGLAIVIFGFLFAEERYTTYAYSGFLFIVFVGGYITCVEMRKFRCPTCGESIQKPESTGNERGVAVLFFCKRCNTRWDTGLKTPTVS